MTEEEKSTSNRQIGLSKTLLYVCKLLHPTYPSYYFPIYLIVKFIQKFSFQFEVRQLDFLLRAVPNSYFDLLTSNHQIYSDHTIFVNQKVFDYYVYQKNINFLNLSLSDATKKQVISTVENVVNKILDSSENTKKSDKTMTLVQVFPLPGVPINKIFIKENCYWNYVEKFKLHDDQVYVNLSMLDQNQMLPGVATKVNIFLVKSPYDLPTLFIDDVLTEYFNRPRTLYRNHTYRVDLTEEVLGNFKFVEHFGLITKLKKIYFKCVHLESTGSTFENIGIVLNSLTALHQSTTINYQVPRILMGDQFLTSYPLGHKCFYNKLRNTILPFTMEKTKSKLLEQGIFPVIQIHGERGSGKRKIVQSVADSFGMHIHFAECCEVVNSISSQTEQKVLHTLHKATNCHPIIICFNDFEFFGLNNEGHEDDRVINYFKNEIEKLFTKQSYDAPIIIVALVNSNEPLKSTKLSEVFLETIGISLLDSEQRFLNLLWYHLNEKYNRLCYRIKIGEIENYINEKIQNISKSEIAVLRNISSHAQGLSLGDLRILYQKSTQPPTEKLIENNLIEENFMKSLNDIKKCFNGNPEIVKVKWDDIGGLANLKAEIQNSIGLPLKYSHLMNKNLKRSGILLFGPPGTGKTLIAKAVATECNLSFLSVQGPEILNMYVGQSEQNVRDVFAKARASAPCVIFLDELDSLAPIRGVAGDSGGVMDRVVSQLLSEMDAVDDDLNKPVFILAATNRPDLIDKQLLRPGRFDKMLYVGPCTTLEDKILVLKSLTKKFKLEKDLTADKIAKMIKSDVTGADIYSICSNAWINAVRREVKHFDKGQISENDLTADAIVVQTDDFKKSMSQFVSSLNQVDMEYFNKLQHSYD